VYQLRGVDAIRSALEGGTRVELLLVLEASEEPGIEALRARAGEQGVPVRDVTAAVIRRMTSVGPPAESLALVGRNPGVDLSAAFARRGAVWLLVGTAYPSNAGMVIRTAEGSGAEAIAIDADWDHDSRRTALRTSMRADWYMPVFWEPAARVLESARSAGHRVFAIENTGALAPWDVDLTGPSLFVVGGEADGIPSDVLAKCDDVLRLPMAGFIPSYNLQSAVSVVAVERLRQVAKALA
jgi:TrmH family RNA methyltransferase